MHVFSVGDPDNHINPIPKDKRAGRLLVYHGTSAMYSSKIESDGFKPHILPYEMEDVSRILGLFDQLGWKGERFNYPTLASYTRGTNGKFEKLKPIYFAFNYEKAWIYASNQGGETIKAIVWALEELEDYCSDEQCRNHHKNRLLRELEDIYDPSTKKDLNDRIEKIGDKALIRKVQGELPIYRQKYKPIYDGHVPVIYAIEVEENWFNEKPTAEEDDLRCLVPILSDRLFARVDFPNGIHYKIIPNSEYESAEGYIHDDDSLFKSNLS
jgi:hypothetical protein